MERRIIGAKPPPGAVKPGHRPRKAIAPAQAADSQAQGPEPVPESAAPAVRRLRVDGESAGQRLDNFLLRLLKGVPKTHVYRVIRSGEVRVNGGRASADTRLGAGDEVRVPPVRVAQREAAAQAPARDFLVLMEDEHLLAHPLVSAAAAELTRGWARPTLPSWWAIGPSG